MLSWLFTKIAGAVLGNAFAGALAAGSSAYELYSLFETYSGCDNVVTADAGCDELNVHGVKVISEELTGQAIDLLLQNSTQRFNVEKTGSGIYIASKLIEPFKVPDQGQFERYFSRSGPFSKSGGPFKPYTG